MRKRQCVASAPRTTRTSDSVRTCPSPERILAFAEGSAACEDAEDVLDHLLHCENCRSALSFSVAASAVATSAAHPSAKHLTAARGTPKRSSRKAGRAPGSTTSSLAWKRVAMTLMRRSMLAKRVSDESVDAIAAESGENSIVFRSDSDAPAARAWFAEVVLPPLDTVDAPLEVRMHRKRRGTALDGMFVVCGIQVPVAAGKGVLDRREFVSHLEVGGVSFTEAGREPISGAPVFGSFA